MGNIPGPQKERFYEKKYVVELIAILPPLVTAAVGALVNLGDPAKRTLGWWLAGATAWLALASLTKVLHAAVQDRERKRARQYGGLRGSLWVLYEATRQVAALTAVRDGTLRVTIHRVIPDLERLEQLLPYIGGTGGPPGRTFSIRSGVVGQAVRAKTPISSARKNQAHADFVKELVHDWFYTDEDARAVTPDRQAWMAVPVLMPSGDVSAVVCLDSNVPDFFSDLVQEVVLSCCAGITAYVVEVY
jgi:putative methionine-R-sulfoxide reductase with GAF domain